MDFFMRAMTGYRFSIMMGLAARLDLADHLKNGPQTYQDLGRQTGTNPDSLYRFLRCLVGIGLLIEGPKGSFVLTPMGTCLQTDHPAGFKDIFLLHTSEPFLNAWQQLPYSVQTGETAFNHVYGMGAFEYAAANPSYWQLSDKAFTARSNQQTAAIVGAYDFSGFARVADIGGGNGALLAAILNQSPEIHGVLFDLPQVVQRAPAVLEAAGVVDRCEIVGGSFFESVPAGCDVYALKAIIHDWDDTRALTILKNCRAAMKPNSKLLTIGSVLPEIMDSNPASIMATIRDLEMLVMAGGRERTESDLRQLYGEAGLYLNRVIPIPDIARGGSIVEGVIA